jgi:hypothetical protein
MVIQRYALVRSTDGAVVNVCVWDGVTPWDTTLPNTNAVECLDGVSPGWSYDGGEWIPPTPPEDPPPEE